MEGRRTGATPGKGFREHLVNKRLVGLVVACLLCLAHRASAAVNGWTGIGPTGGYVNKVVFSQDGKTAYAIATGGFYRSQDGGVSWQLVRNDFLNMPFDLAIDPADPMRVYVAEPNWPSLYVSTDGGATLAPATNLPTAITQALQVVVSANGQTLYIASGAKIFRSSDRAQSWQLAGTVSTDPAAWVNGLAIDPTDANTLYAAASTSASAQGILASHDGGATWQSLLFAANPGSSGYAYGIAVNPANPLRLWAARTDGVWTSADRGLHWTNSLSTPVYVVAEDPVNPSIVYAGTGSGNVYRTQDSGASWLDVSGNLFVSDVFSIAIDPSLDSHLLVSGTAGIGGTTSSGNTWRQQQAGLVSTYVAAFSADAGADRIYLEVPSAGLYYVAAGAATTTAVNNAGLGYGMPFLNTLLVNTFMAQPGRLWVAQGIGLDLSLDGGNTWQLPIQVAPTGSLQVVAMASAPGAPQVLLAASSAALYRSADGGNLWTQVTGGLPAGQISRLLMGPADPLVAYAFVAGSPSSPGVYRSADAGLNWTAAGSSPASGPAALLALDPSSSNVLYGMTEKLLLKSTDGGTSWSTLTWDPAPNANGPGALAIDPVHPQTLYAGGMGRVARSVDGGATWETLRAASALPSWSTSAMIVDPNRPASLMLATTSSGVQQITIAPDLALQLNSPANPVPIGVATSFGYTVSNQGPFDATGVTVTLQFPASAQGALATISGGSCTVAASTATCSLGVLRTGGTAAITLSAVLPAAGAFSIAGSVQGDQPDPVALNNATTTALNVGAVADLSVTVTGTASAQAGGSVSYTLAVKNDGPNAAPAATVTFQFAAGLTPGAVTSTNGTCTTAGSLATCTLSDLAPAGGATIIVGGNAALVGQQASTATIASDTSDPASANNSATVTTSVSPQPSPPSQGGGGGGAMSMWEALLLAFASFARPRTSVRRPGG
jgi:MprA protease rhombosortase-interaction domain-containing protein